MTGGAAGSTVLTSSRKQQQRSIRDFFISPPAIPSAKRLKTQSHATISAQTSGTSVEAAQSSAAHCSRADGSVAQASSASESAPCFSAAGNKEAAASKLTQHSNVQSEAWHALQRTQHVQQHCGPPQPKSSQPRSKSGDVQLHQTLVRQAAVSVMTSDALPSTVNLNAVQCHVVEIPAHLVAYREVKDQPDAANMHFEHDDKENVHEVGMQACQ